jgi:hypothetical protein
MPRKWQDYPFTSTDEREKTEKSKIIHAETSVLDHVECGILIETP